MEISGIRSTMPFMFQGTEKGASQKQATGDVVDIQQPQILSDEEAETVFNDTLSMIAHDAVNALSVHSGLSEDRVFALLGA